jgi:hypothetical protein
MLSIAMPSAITTRSHIMKMKKNIPIKQLRVAPIRHEKLTPEQELRARAIHETFYEQDPRSLAKALEDFRRDMHPDREIAIWERMAEAYRRQVSAHKTKKERKKLFERILRGSLESDRISVYQSAPLPK